MLGCKYDGEYNNNCNQAHELIDTCWDVNLTTS